MASSTVLLKLHHTSSPLLLILLLHISKVISTFAEIPPPAAAIFLIEEGGNNTDAVDFSKKVIKGGSETESVSVYPDPHKILLNDIVNTDVEVTPGRKVELECMASNPVQWSYRGPGRPEFTTNVTVDLLNKREVHKATPTITSANEKDSGLYVCNYAEFPRIASTYHIFVAGSEIFVSDSGRTISYSSGMPVVTIPCPVSVKRAKVTLRKVYFDNSLRVLDAPVAIFDPKSGFKLNVGDLRDAEGVYICSGYYDGTLRVREYLLRNEERNHTSAVTFPEGIQEDINPCISYSCPSRSVCRVNLNTNSPFCACEPKIGSPLLTNCTRLCKISQCAVNAECYVDEQRGAPKCRCKRGFQGNGNNNCERIPLKPDEQIGTSYCSSAKCGPNAKCQNVAGKVQCVCYVGHFGSWPNCEKACTQDTDCNLQDRCSPTKGVCEHACTDNLCAPKAECKVLHRKPMCICPAGYTGKATEACYPSHYYYSSRSGLPSDAESSADSFQSDTTTGRVVVNEEISVQDEEESGSLKLSLPVSSDDDESNTRPPKSLKFSRR